MGAEISTMSSYQTGQLISIGSELKVSMASAINVHDSKKYTIFQYEKENGKLPENVDKHMEVKIFLFKKLGIKENRINIGTT